MGKWWIAAGGVLLLGAAIPVALALRRPEPVPASGRCPACDVPLARVRYGKGVLSCGVYDSLSVDGASFQVSLGTANSRFLIGRDGVSDAQTGHDCLECRRTWVLDPDAASRRPFWTRLRGGLLRLL